MDEGVGRNPVSKPGEPDRRKQKTDETPLASNRSLTRTRPNSTHLRSPHKKGRQVPAGKPTGAGDQRRRRRTATTARARPAITIA